MAGDARADGLAMSRAGRCALVLLLAASASAAQATWRGGADGRWSVAANWVEGAAPAAGDEAVVTGAGGVADLAGVALGGLRLRDATIGGELAVAGPIAVEGGVARLACRLALPAPARIAVARDARLVLAGAVDDAQGIELDGDGAVEVAAPIAGAGGLTSRVASLTLGAAGSYAGPTRLERGVVRFACDSVADVDGACGRARTPIAVDGARIELAAARCERAIALGAKGARIVAVGGARALAASIASGGWRAGGILGTYFAKSLRSVRRDDWRGAAPAPTGTRLDAKIFFPETAFGTADERKAFAIGGTPRDWDDFSIQWDGWLRVFAATDLWTWSDDGSRVWIDRDWDGAARDEEWGDNGWGQGHGAQTVRVQRALQPGIYRIRVQYEEGGGANCMALCWDDAAHAAGDLDGHRVVPADAFVEPSPLELVAGADAPLEVGGAISGEGLVIAPGPGRLTLRAPPASLGGLVVTGGEAVLADQALARPIEATVAAGARLRLAGDARVAALAGSGAVRLDGATTFDVPVDRPTRIALAVDGDGGVIKRGAGALTFTGATSWRGPTRVEDGSLHLVARGERTAAIALRAPLTTVAAIPDAPSAGGLVVDADLDVPADAPDDLGVGAWIADRHGRWWQTARPGTLPRGRSVVRFDLGAARQLAPESQAAAWSPATAADAAQCGLFFWSRRASTARVRVATRVRAGDPDAARAHRLADVAPQDVADGVARARTGERWQLTFTCAPRPVNPYDASEFSADAIFTGADGAAQRVPAFWLQPMRGRDRGDEEEVVPAGRGSFAVRFRPREPGRYAVALEARWRDGATRRVSLPPLDVAGEAWDGYARVDAEDPRFFAVDGRWFWPIGLNIRSVNDPRDQQCLRTALTPDRGSLAYEAYLARLGAAGGTACEIWMAPWNLALEWRGDWRGFHGQGRYSDENAWRLDRVLDAAWRHGVRVNLVVHNHGQGSDGTDHEWEDSPYNALAGGRLAAAADFFGDAWALAGQENLRRYVVARWADHPAVLGWKLWSEVNLTAAGGRVVAWHERATARWRALDGYGHPCTTHWAGDYNAVDRRVAALPGLGYVCIDAYHGGRLLADLLDESIRARGGGLGSLSKPVLVTEYGGSPGAGPPAQIEAELASAPWVGLVCGFAGSPMLWWYEWVDQGDRWSSYGAIARFTAGEDARGADARSIALRARSPAGALWARAWFRPGRMLGYLLDRRWGADGLPAPAHDAAAIDLGDDVAPGPMVLEWWDADRGERIARSEFAHPGGALTLSAPRFERHLAFKLARGAAAPR